MQTDPGGHWRTRRTPDPDQETETKIVWLGFKVFWLSKDNSTGHSERTKKEADRRRGGKTILKSEQEWTLPAQLGRLKTGRNGKGLLRTHLWCPNDLSRLWDRIEKKDMDLIMMDYFLLLLENFKPQIRLSN